MLTKEVPLLSPRRQQVFDLLADGLTAKEIGHALHISEKTADTHIYAVMHLLHIHGVKRLIAFASREKCKRELSGIPVTEH